MCLKKINENGSESFSRKNEYVGKWAIITGADGGMGVEITRALAVAGYRVIMACRRLEKAEKIKRRIQEEIGSCHLEVLPVDLSSMDSVVTFTQKLLERRISVKLLMNNAATMATDFHLTVDGFEQTVSVNYLSAYLLTRRLLPILECGARIVNMVSCTYVMGRLCFPNFFRQGRKGSYWRIPVYSNTKLALLLFTFELAGKLQERNILVNAADPGIVSTNMITMHKWFDPLTNVFFRPFIRTPKQGASTAIQLLLDEQQTEVTGRLYVGNKQKKLSDKYVNHTERKQLWDETESLLSRWLL